MLQSYWANRPPQKKPKAPKIEKERTLIRSAKHLKYVRSLRCATMVCESREIEAAHLSMEGVPASERGGTGIKPSDVVVVPLCRAHHREGPPAWARDIRESTDATRSHVAGLRHPSSRPQLTRSGGETTSARAEEQAVNDDTEMKAKIIRQIILSKTEQIEIIRQQIEGLQLALDIIEGKPQPRQPK